MSPVLGGSGKARPDGYITSYINSGLEIQITPRHEHSSCLPLVYLYLRDSMLVCVAAVWVQNNASILKRGIHLFANDLYRHLCSGGLAVSETEAGGTFFVRRSNPDAGNLTVQEGRPSVGRGGRSPYLRPIGACSVPGHGDLNSASLRRFRSLLIVYTPVEDGRSQMVAPLRCSGEVDPWYAVSRKSRSYPAVARPIETSMP